MVTIATFLARAKMAEMEDLVLEEGFTDNDQEEEGDFGDAGLARDPLEDAIEKVELPADMAQQAQDADQGADGERQRQPAGGDGRLHGRLHDHADRADPGGPRGVGPAGHGEGGLARGGSPRSVLRGGHLHDRPGQAGPGGAGHRPAARRAAGQHRRPGTGSSARRRGRPARAVSPQQPGGRAAPPTVGRHAHEHRRARRPRRRPASPCWRCSWRSPSSASSPPSSGAPSARPPRSRSAPRRCRSGPTPPGWR